MEYDAFERKIIELCEMGNFDKAEEEKKHAMPFVKSLLKKGDKTGNKFLELFSQLAGEAESFSNFSDFLDDLTCDGLITKEYAETLIAGSPSNRWL